MLSRRQLMTLWLGVAATVLMAVFPPWEHTYNAGVVRASRPGDYHPIFAPPVPMGGHNGVRIDAARLMLQVLAVATVTGAAILTQQRRRE